VVANRYPYQLRGHLWKVPEALLNQPVEAVLIPTQRSEDRETRRRQLQVFFGQ
jgi:hypothetical protein